MVFDQDMVEICIHVYGYEHSEYDCYLSTGNSVMWGISHCMYHCILLPLDVSCD